ncbi:T9SS type A sorting domain-containing protein [Algibacter mikhailovii]|uniref:Secretion system C-terminal sorting domain-containing protein n=1 Tax=Algibacter mikhailovii TaxID=425498 RepID=A0A918QSU9_9FLAO|nr:T9SS type A sorting domain-containing protein [Algibacter mikhailovii]GGZ68713.1 hypothetical protein GCM10007028_02040 [Algibacter mikhailovii]
MKKITILTILIFAMTMTGQNKLLSSTEEFFDGMTWQSSSGTNYAYDSNNNLISETGLSLNFISSQWENSYRATYSYNGNNVVTNEIDQSWNSITKQFENLSQSKYTYNGSNITEVLDQRWENGSWRNDLKSEFIYSSGRIVQAFNYTWDGSQWVPEDRSNVTYNANGRFGTILTDDWNGTSWVNGERQMFSYDSNNKIKVMIYDTWDGTKWEEEDRIEYTLDANGNRTQEVNIYDGSSFTTTYTYDTSQLMSSFAHPFKDKTGLDYIVQDNPYYNKLLSSLQDGSFRTTYNYDRAIRLGVADVVEVNNNVKVYPVPTTGPINIKSTKGIINHIDIYNTLGKRVFSTQETSFNIDFLNKGVYFLKMTSLADAVYTRKIIKK